ncbi:putative reverse transcriptase domain-containing protein [Tanacetum coccineum]
MIQSTASLFFLRQNTQVYLEYSSTMTKNFEVSITQLTDADQVKCKYVTRNTGKRRKNEENADSYKSLRRNLTDALRHHGFVGYPFDYRVTLGFGSIAAGLDLVNPVIRLPLEHGIRRVLGKDDYSIPRTMAGLDINTLTMEQDLALSRENQAPGVVKPKIRGNVNFEIKSQFMRELREDTFSGNKSEDAHDHDDRVINIVSLINILRISQDALLLRGFLFTLTGSAKRWVDILTPGAVNTWDLLKKAFIQRYCPPSKTAKRLEDIHNFNQLSDESLYQAWERYNALLYKCPTYDINNHQKGPIPRMTPTQTLTAIQTMAAHSQKWHEGASSRNISNSSDTDGLAAVISKLDNLGRDMNKLKENVHAIQVGCQICEGPHLDKECPLNEEVKQVVEVKYGEFGRPAPFNGSSGAKFRVGPTIYYMRTDNQTSSGEKKPKLVETINKYMEEATKRQAEQNEWLKTLC